MLVLLMINSYIGIDDYFSTETVIPYHTSLFYYFLIAWIFFLNSTYCIAFYRVSAVLELSISLVSLLGRAANYKQKNLMKLFTLRYVYVHKSTNFLWKLSKVK